MKCLIIAWLLEKWLVDTLADNEKSAFGLACSKAGEKPLQGFCEEFDSLRVHKKLPL